MMSNSADIIAAINAAIGDAPRPVHLHEPLFIGNEKKYVDSCIDEGWVSSVGAYVDRFEQDLADYCGAKKAVVTVNGTCALHIALITLGVQAGDEVLIPALTFVATANAVSHAGAVPHFVEVEEVSLGVCPLKLDAYLAQITICKNGKTINKNTGRVISALIPVHIFGHPCQISALAKIAEKYGLLLLEDATEALGSTMNKKPVGSQHTAVLSFNGNKIITTGGGGAILTNDDALYLRLKHLTTTAKQPHKWAFNHDEIAWNYRMPNLNAAMGCAQLEQLPKFLIAKHTLAAKYIETFTGVKNVQILPEPAGTNSNYWLITLLAERGSSEWLNATLKSLHEAGLLCRPIWQPLHLLDMYNKNPRANLQLTEELATRIINLPSSVKLGMQNA
jgi:perosamine synthetase